MEILDLVKNDFYQKAKVLMLGHGGTMLLLDIIKKAQKI